MQFGESLLNERLLPAARGRYIAPFCMKVSASIFLLLFLCLYGRNQAQELTVSEYMLYIGKSYISYPLTQVGSPTFRNYNFDSDTELSFHGQNYKDRMLIYDLVLNELVIFHPEKEIPLILPKEWVDRFVIKQDTFVNLDHKDWPGLPASGFYQKHFDAGGLLCLVSYSKELKDELHHGNRVRVFNESIRYYIRAKDEEVFQEVSKHSHLLKLDRKNRRKNRRALYELGLHGKDRLGDAILLVLSNMNQGTDK